MTTRTSVRARLRGGLRGAIALTLTAGLAACDEATSPRSEAEEVLIGGLFSLTGNWSTLGQASQAAMEIGIEDVNEFLAGNESGLRFAAAIEDTKLDPALARSQAEALRDRGVQILIGPQSSAEVAALKGYADSTGLLVVSQSSTAGTLTLAGDNVFRFTPADSLEGIAVATLMRADGIDAIVTVWRDDAGNVGLERAASGAFDDLGGRVLGGVSYGATTQGFAATVAALRAEMDVAIAEHGAAKVGVYLAAFDEVAALFEAAAADPVLGTVRWYGSDGVARSEVVLANAAAVDFAIQVGYPNPIFGLEEAARERWEPLAARIAARAGVEPDAFALAVYDAVWVAAQSHLATGPEPRAEDLRRTFVAAANAYYGATGWTALNAAGDRRYGDFDFWTIERRGGTPLWVRSGRYETQAGRLVRE